jgi:site-specific recombinase XerD
MKLTACLHEFFDQYLPHIKGVRENTMDAYRHTFSLFLPFAARSRCIDVRMLTLEDLAPELILSFLNHLEAERQNTAATRNHRLAALKSFARMVRLLYPESQQYAEKILNIPKKRTRKPLIGYLFPDEILRVFNTVDLGKNEGFRDYTILHLLSDSGTRATEIATLNLDYFNYQNKTLAILGKGNRFRQIELTEKTADLINLYIDKYRPKPKPPYRHRLFVNQQGKELTRHGINRICRKYLHQALPEKRLKGLNPAHSFRHSCAVNMLCSGKDITEIKNRLGHEKLETTMVYLKLDMSRKRQIQKEFIQYTQSSIATDPKINDLIDWENKEKTLAWLDSL